MSITINGSTNTIVGSTGTASISGVTNILSGATANFTDFPRAQVVVSTANTGVTDPGIHAIIAEAKSDGTYNAYGLDGCAATNGAGAAAGISGSGRVTATGDTGNAMGAYCAADMTHAGGANYGVFSSASNGATNYSFYGAAGTLYNAGGINTTPIGNVTPSTGAFTTLSASGTISSSAINSIQLSNAAANINGTDVTGTLTISNSSGGAYMQVFGASHATRSNEMDVTAAGGIKLLNNTTVTGQVSPSAHNTYDLGTTGVRWKDLWLQSGAFNGSDARLKTAIAPLTTNEINAAKQLSKEIGTYQWLESVQKKGDAARHHVGFTVQRAIEILQLTGCDPFAYGFIGYDKWDDVFVEHAEILPVAAVEAKEAILDVDGNEIEPAITAVEAVEGKAAWTEHKTVAGDAYSFRYDQLNMFVAAGLEARLSALEAK